MVPKLLKISDLKLPTHLNYWFSNEGNKIRLWSDSIKNPVIYLGDKISVEGEWIYKKGSSVIRSINGKEETLSYDENAMDYVIIGNEIYPILRKGKNILFEKEKYNALVHKYAFKILENKNKIVVFFEGNKLEFDKPIAYRINPTYINLVYNGSSLIIDIYGNRRVLNRSEFYLGTSSKGDLFQTIAGKIVTESEFDLLGVCTSEAYFLGELSTGLVIVCGNKIKHYYKGGWAFLSNTNSLTSNYVTYNYLVVTDLHTTVYNGEMKKMFNLNNVHAVAADRKNLFIISDSKKIYVVEPSNDYDPIGVSYLKGGNTIILNVDKNALGSVRLGKGLIKVSETESDRSLIIQLEPTRLLSSGRYTIEVENELYTYSKEISFSLVEPELSLVKGVIIVTKTGRIKGYEDYYNAIAKLNVRFKVLSKLGATIKVRIMSKEYSFALKDQEGELSLNIPIVKFDLNEETVLLTLERNGFVEVMKEYVIKVESVKENTIYTTEEVTEDAVKRIINKAENDVFKWERVSEFPDPYDNVIIAKAGDKINVEQHEFYVRQGVQEVVVVKEGYRRKYVVYGIQSPIKSVKSEIRGDNILIKVELHNRIPITVIYGTQIKTSTDGLFEFKVDPTYSEIIVKAFYSNEIKWEHIYALKDLFRVSLTNARKISETIARELSNYGII